MQELKKTHTKSFFKQIKDSDLARTKDIILQIKEVKGTNNNNFFICECIKAEDYDKKYVHVEVYNEIKKMLDEQKEINSKLIDENNNLHKDILDIYMDNAELKRNNDKLEKAVLVSGSD